MYGFEGWLLKVNGVLFPTKYIRADTYTVTPDQETDLDDYTDNDGIFHRNVLPAKATKIEFNIKPCWLPEMVQVRSILPDARVEVDIEYWNDYTLSYQSGKAYIPDISYSYHIIDAEKKNIQYSETRVAFIEYGKIRGT